MKKLPSILTLQRSRARRTVADYEGTVMWNISPATMRQTLIGLTMAISKNAATFLNDIVAKDLRLCANVVKNAIKEDEPLKIPAKGLEKYPDNELVILQGQIDKANMYVTECPPQSGSLSKAAQDLGRGCIRALPIVCRLGDSSARMHTAEVGITKIVSLDNQLQGYLKYPEAHIKIAKNLFDGDVDTFASEWSQKVCF